MTILFTHDDFGCRNDCIFVQGKTKTSHVIGSKWAETAAWSTLIHLKFSIPFPSSAKKHLQNNFCKTSGFDRVWRRQTSPWLVHWRFQLQTLLHFFSAWRGENTCFFERKRAGLLSLVAPIHLKCCILSPNRMSRGLTSHAYKSIISYILWVSMAQSNWCWGALLFVPKIMGIRSSLDIFFGLFYLWRDFVPFSNVYVKLKDLACPMSHVLAVSFPFHPRV